MRGQMGYMLYETLASVVVIGVLGATAAPHLINMQPEVLEQTVRGSAANLASAKRLFHAKWLTNGRMASVPGYHSKASKQGFPSGQSSDNRATKADCELIWQDLLQTSAPPTYSEVPEEKYFSWTSSASDKSNCYFVLSNDSASAAIIYNIATGDVRIQ